MRILVAVLALSFTSCTTIRIARPEYYTCKQVVVYSRMDVAQRVQTVIQVCKPIEKTEAERYYKEIR